jgi:hypothetical protein
LLLALTTMPYRISGKTVQVKLSWGWDDLKKHPTAEKAQKHLIALKRNVGHRTRPRKRK